MLVHMEELLLRARENGYAVPAFDIADLAFARAVSEAAEEQRSPAILMVLAQGEGKTFPWLAAIAKSVAERSTAPLALHLDHGHALADCRRAVEEGFTGVMLSGGELSLSENIERTREVVSYARPYGVAVEGELGCMGEGVEGVLTDPEQAHAFLDATRVQALAVSVGTAHGVYRTEPRLEVGLLKDIADRCPVPLVLHGGSGTPADQLRMAVALGVAKINFYTEVAQAFIDSYAELSRQEGNAVPLPDELCGVPIERMKKVIRIKMEICGSVCKTS